MVASAITSGNGVVLINIPAGGATGEVLTKLSNEDFDFDWAAGGGGGNTIIVEDEGVPLATPADTLNFVGAGVTASGAGTTKTITIPGGAGDLQAAYDADTSVPQIVINATPDPLTIDPSVAGDVFAVRDLAAADLLRIGTTAGSIFGGTNAGNSLLIQGSQNAPDVGRVEIASPIDLTYDTVSNTTPAEPFVFSWEQTFTVGAYVGGFLNFDPTITTTSPTYIPGVFVDFGSTTVGAAPGFWAYTFINCLHDIRSGAGFNFGNALVVNIGIVHSRETAGTSTTPGGTTGMNVAPQTRAEVSGAVARKTTGDTGITVNPSYSAVLGATADMGTTLGLRIGGNATVPFGGSSAGTLIRDAIIGLDHLNTTDTVGGDIAAVRTAVTNGANRYLLLNNGGVDSEHGAGDIHFNDNAGLLLGNTLAAPDVTLNWNGSALDILFALNSDDLLISNPVNGQILFDVGADEFTFNTTRGVAFGDQTGTLGNAYFNFVQGNITPSAAGEFSGVLLTQSGQYTNNGLTRARVSAWVINGLSYANDSGTVTESDTLTVGGMVTSSPGVTITDRQSLHVIAGRSRFDSAIQFETISPATLAAGDNNNWGGLLTGTANNGMRQWARVTGNATQSTITGIDATEAQDGDWFTLTNIGAETVLLSHQDAASTDVNRIITTDGNNFVLTENASVDIRYDDTTERWRIVTPPPAVAPLTGQWQFDNTTTMADPGAGNFRNNNATIGSVTSIAVADETKPGTDASNILAALASGDQLYIQNQEDASEFLVFNITGTTDNTTWWQIDGTVNASGANFTDGKEFLLTFLFA